MTQMIYMLSLFNTNEGAAKGLQKARRTLWSGHMPDDPTAAWHSVPIMAKYGGDAPGNEFELYAFNPHVPTDQHLVPLPRVQVEKQPLVPFEFGWRWPRWLGGPRYRLYPGKAVDGRRWAPPQDSGR